jgi:hypothetical protein
MINSRKTERSMILINDVDTSVEIQLYRTLLVSLKSMRTLEILLQLINASVSIKKTLE